MTRASGFGGHDPARGLHTVDHWHREVHEHDVRLLALHRRDRFVSVGRAAHEVDVVGGGEQLLEPAATTA